MYSLHDLEVIGLPIKEVLECRIESMIGKHSTLMILAYVDEKGYFLHEIPDFQSVEVLVNGKAGKELLFSGIITNIQVTESGQTKLIRIEGKSRSWLTDRTRRSRSFQNTKMSFRELVKEVLKCYEDYGEDSLFYAGEEQETGSLIVQYQETDWEFLQRVLSLSGLMLTPDSRKEGLKLYAGIPSFAAEELSGHVLEMEKDMGAYYRLKANGRNVHTADFTRYHISSGQLFGIFDSVEIQGQSLAVYSARYLFEDQVLTGFYGLQGFGGLVQAAVYPMHLIGVALVGKVTSVSGTKVQVALEIDGGHKERTAYWFPYSTLSASKDGSGWYCMPEIGDNVRVYFPSKQEGEAIALSSVSNYNAPQNGGEDRMKNPDSRYLRTKAGQELALAPEYIRLSCREDTAAVTIKNDGKVTIQSQVKVEAEAEEELTLHAEEELKIHVLKTFKMESLDGGLIEAQEGKVLLRGTEVNFD